jgi:hypothetical protein
LGFSSGVGDGSSGFGFGSGVGGGGFGFGSGVGGGFGGAKGGSGGLFGAHHDEADLNIDSFFADLSADLDDGLDAAMGGGEGGASALPLGLGPLLSHGLRGFGPLREDGVVSARGSRLAHFMATDSVNPPTDFSGLGPALSGHGELPFSDSRAVRSTHGAGSGARSGAGSGVPDYHHTAVGADFFESSGFFAGMGALGDDDDALPEADDNEPA